MRTTEADAPVSSDYHGPMVSPSLRRWCRLMSLGGYPGETDIQRGKRRIVVGYFVFGALTRLPFSASEYAEGLPGIGVVDLTGCFWAPLPSSLMGSSGSSMWRCSSSSSRS
jgi:hypothetical protein